jgi:hypothetical protein
MDIAGIILGSIGILATLFVAWLVFKKTGKLFRRIELIQAAEMTVEKYRELLRLVEDGEVTGQKRGTIKQNKDGKWIIEWQLEAKDGVKFSAKPEIEVNRSNQKI